MVFSGTANPALAEAVSREAGMPLGKCEVERFPDGEVTVRLATPVRGKEVFLLQSTSPPVDEHLVELLAFADACRRAAAARITAIIPYFGYSRADKRVGRREPIMARVVADVLAASGVHHLIFVDPHTPQLEGFFCGPVDSLTAVPTLCRALAGRLPEGAVVVAPDAGRVQLATDYANRLGIPLVVLHKRRESGTETHVTHVVGDVADRPCLIVDDMISTGGTIAGSVEALLEAGARPEMVVAATHGLFVGSAREKLSHPAVREIVVADTVPPPAWDRPPVRVASVAPLLAEAIRRILSGGSLRELF
ncbi:MAG TPA: ribose-phosphate pyrophosphokinase [Thermomicrobiales bacterium]